MEPGSSSDSLIFGVLVIMIMLSFIFSASETALLSVNKIKLRNMVDDGVKGAKNVEALVEKQKEVLTTLLISNNIINISASAIATSVAVRYSDVIPNAVFWTTAILTALILLFGEVIPKNVAAKYAESIMILFHPLISVALVVLKPFEIALNFVSKTFMRLFRIDIDKKVELITEDELKTMVNVSHEEGILEVHESKMINNIFEFADQEAQDIMTPRVNMVAISVNSTFEEVVKVYDEERFSRLPIYDGDIDNIIGLIYIKDIAFCDDKEKFDIRDYIREHYVAYETKKIDELFKIMKQNRISVAIVLDEYGATAGMVTMQDIIEEIFGEVNDEDDIEEDDEIQQLNENEFLINGILRISDLNDEVGTEITSEDYETVGGYVIGLVGDLPQEHDEIISEEFNLKFNIELIDKNRIEKMRLTILDTEYDSDDEDEE